MRNTSNWVVALVALGAALFMAQSAPSAEITWSQSLTDAWKQAVAQRRPLLMVFTMRGCHFCTKLEQQTFRDRAVSSRVNSRFVAVMIDADQAGALAEKLGVQAYPTSIVVSPDGNIVKHTIGYLAPSQMDVWLTDANKSALAIRR